MRLQLALNVQNLDQAIEFYRQLFGVDVHKREPGYANFEIDQPPLKLVLFESADGVERLNHVGVEVFDDRDVASQAQRLSHLGVETLSQENEVCCFAAQNKVITHAPDGLMWEWYRITDDAPAEKQAPACCSATAQAQSCCT